MIYFFDTSALQHRYIDGPKSRSIRRTISMQGNTCYICDLTVLEIASALAAHCRRAGLPVTKFAQMDQAFWKDIHEGKLQILEATRRSVLRARHLLRYAGVEKRKNLRSGDALIAARCLEFALGVGAPVKFCLEDWTLYQVIRDIAAFNSAMGFRFIGVDKSRASSGGK